MDKEDIIIEYLKRLDADVREVRNDLRSFKDDTKDAFKEVKYSLRVDQEKLEQVYDARNKNIISLGRSFVGINAVLASLVAFFVSFFVK